MCISVKMQFAYVYIKCCDEEPSLWYCQFLLRLDMLLVVWGVMFLLETKYM